jgi:hypothetical protein
VPRVVDQHPVQTFAACGTHPSFCVGVRSGARGALRRTLMPGSGGDPSPETPWPGAGPAPGFLPGPPSVPAGVGDGSICGDQVAVPAQQRGRGDQERGPPRPRWQPGQGREHRPIRRFQIQAIGLTTQHATWWRRTRISTSTARPPRMPNMINCSTSRRIRYPNDTIMPVSLPPTGRPAPDRTAVQTPKTSSERYTHRSRDQRPPDAVDTSPAVVDFASARVRRRNPQRADQRILAGRVARTAFPSGTGIRHNYSTGPGRTDTVDDHHHDRIDAKICRR